MFFKAGSVQPQVEGALADAYMAPQEGNLATAQAKAKQAASAAISGATGLVPQWATFIAAAVVFLILLAATIYVAGQADAQPKEVTTSQLKDLSKILQTLLVAWSAAVVGLIAGAAVGKKTS